MKKFSIYVHIPFCEKKCKYCDFCSFHADKNFIIEYFDLLKNECIEKSKMFKDRCVDTIYFGGGTPSSVDERFIVDMLNTIKKNYNIDNNAEITIECNPGTVNRQNLLSYKNAGVNRISFGVQSFNDDILISLGRIHTAKQAIEAIELAKCVGYENISCDLMLGVPKQTDNLLLKDLKKFVDLEINHISCYTLQLEENTPLFEEVKKGIAKVDNDDNLAKKYQKMQLFLKKHGFFQYEVSNFAKNNNFSRHNLNYWRRGDYLGVGLSAHSFIDGVRFANSCNINEYKSGIVSKETLTQREIAEEIIMLRLRYFEGIDLVKLKECGVKLIENASCQKYIDNGVLTLDGEHLKLNPDYYEVNNQIIVDLFNW